LGQSMTRYILIAGLIPYDSGKTWFTLGASLYVRNMGFKVGVLKPVAAHNAWYSPRTLRKSIELGLLVGNDALLYYSYGLMPKPSIGNPIALLMTPPDPLKYSDLGEYFKDVESAYSSTVLSRITSCKANTVKHYHYPSNIEKLSPELTRVISRVGKILKSEESSIRSLLEYLSSPLVEEELDKCLDEASRNVEIVFVESFNDAITPYRGLLSRVHGLGIVAPSRVYVYRDIKAVEKALDEASSRLGWEGFKARYIVEKVKPTTTIETSLKAKPHVKREHELFAKQVVLKV